MFRNSEFLSSILGRSVTDENFITFNLDEDSIFRNLRIMTFRKNIENFQNISLSNTQDVIKKIDSINKKVNLNLIVFSFGEVVNISNQLEEYLINLNKKVLVISKNKLDFSNYFLSRSEIVSDYHLTYFNNDIQYGSKYILKRLLDIALSIFGFFLFSPFFIFIYL